MRIQAHPHGVDIRTLQSIRSIFFESSARKNFAREEDKDSFFNLWTSYYLKNEIESVYTASDSDGDIVGYLMGCQDSRAASAHYAPLLKSYALFADLFAEFPAHLHMNLTESSRGRGLGQRLIDAFLADLKPCAGVHIVTSADARNVHFYRRQGFTHEIRRVLDGREYLFMGRSLFGQGG